MNLLPGALALVFTSLALAGTLPFNELIIFGDSLSDNGNIYVALNGLYPSPPFGYTAARFTNGPDITPGTAYTGVWHEQLALATGLPLTFPALAGGTNLAFGGAESGFGVSSVGTPDLGVQVGLFLQQAPIALSNALYVVEGGSDDILNASTASGATAASIAAAAHQAVLNMVVEIALLATHGAKDFLWFDVPPLDLTPEARTNPLDSAIAAASLQFRAEWAAAVTALEAAYNIDIAPVDLYGLYTQIAANPAQFGLSNITASARDSGAPNPDTYLYWDELHPTTKGHNLIAGAAIQYIDATFVPEPPTAWLIAAFAVPFALRHGLQPRNRRRSRSN